MTQTSVVAQGFEEAGATHAARAGRDVTLLPRAWVARGARRVSSLVGALSALLLLGAAPAFAQQRVVVTAPPASQPMAEPPEVSDDLPHPRPRQNYRALPPLPAQTSPAAPVEAEGTTRGSLFGRALAGGAASQPSSAQASSQPVDRMRKGELSMLGMTEFLNGNNFAGVGLGYFNLDAVHFVSATPMLDLHFLDKRLALHLGATLNFTIFDPNGGGFAVAGKLRRRDWDDPRDFVKILRRFQYGRKEEKLFFRLGRVGAASIGHGTVMRRYNNNLNVNDTRVGLELDAHLPWVGAEAFVGDVTLKSQVLAGLAFVKPLAIFLDHPIPRSLSFGVHYAGDLTAPTALLRDDSGVVLTDGAENPRFSVTKVNFLGADFEIKPVRVGDQVDIKLYGDFTQMLTYGNGITIGTLGRFNFGTSPMFGLRARIEYRNLGDRYLPNYFDMFYEIQKLQVVTVSATTFAPTKLEYLKSFRTGRRRHSFYAEGTFSIVDKFAISVAYERGGGELEQHFLIHAEFTALDWLRFFATYHKRNFGNANELFKFQQNDLVYGQARLEVLPILFINGRMMKSFMWDPGVDFGLGGFRNVLDWKVDVELGWQWG